MFSSFINIENKCLNKPKTSSFLLRLSNLSIIPKSLLILFGLIVVIPLEKIDKISLSIFLESKSPLKFSLKIILSNSSFS